MSPSFTVGGGEYDTKMCNNRIDGASGICEGDIFRRLVSTRDENSRNRTDLPLRPQTTGLDCTTRSTSRDVYRPHLVPLPFPLLDLRLKVVPLLLPIGSSIIRYVASGM